MMIYDIEQKTRKELVEILEVAQEEYQKLANENLRLQSLNNELLTKLEPDIFWDGDVRFDSVEELFDYYGDCEEGLEMTVHCGASLPNRRYVGKYDYSKREWDIKQLEQGE